MKITSIFFIFAVVIIFGVLMTLIVSTKKSGPAPKGSITKKQLTLTRGKPVRLKTGDVMVTLEKTNVPNEQCRDCITSATLTVTRAGESQTVQFQEGGIQGSILTEQQVFGHVLYPLKINVDTLVLSYYIL